MGEFWETIKGIWRLERHGTLKDQLRANRDIMMGKNPYTGKPHLQENIPTRIKRLQKYQYTVSTPRTSEVVKCEMEELKSQIKSATPDELESITQKYNDLKSEYDFLLEVEKARRQMQQDKNERTH